MDELITLNQLKQYDAEKTNKLNVRFDNVYDYVDNGFNNVANDFNNCYNYIDNAINSIDTNVSNLYNYVNNVHNELNETHNNFTTVNLSATNAQITDLNVANVVSNSLDVNTVSINGVVGNNGQVLGVVNGKSEWMDIPDPIDADNFYVNNIYINNIAKVNGLDVTTYTVMAEADYNSMSMSSRSESTFYLTQPNGNLYFKGYGYSPFYIPEAYYSVWVNLSRADWLTSSGNHILFLNTMPVSNNFPSGSGIYGVQNRGVWENSASIGVNALYNNGTTARGIATNAKELYVYDASSMYSLSYTVGVGITDSFIINPSLVVNAPSDYDPMKYCVNMYHTFYNQHGFTGTSPIYIGNNVIDMTETFYNCTNFNQPVTISDSVTSMINTFYNCAKLNSSISVGNNVRNMDNAFYNCRMLNQPIVIPDSVTDMHRTFMNCRGFNSPVTIGNNVTNLQQTFENCSGFNSPIVIPDSVTNMRGAFEYCSNLNQPLIIPDTVTDVGFMLRQCDRFHSNLTLGKGITNMESMLGGDFYYLDQGAYVHISSEINLGDTSNYIYNCLVNGNVGTSIPASRILNDA